MNVSPKRLVPDGRLHLGLAEQREWLRIQSRVAAHPEDGSMRLAGIEAAEVAAPAAAARRRPPPPPSAAKSAATASAKTPPPNPPPPPSAEQAAGSRKFLPGIRGPIRCHCVPDPIHIHACQRAHLARLAADRHRSPLKSELPATEGSSAPLAPAVPLPYRCRRSARSSGSGSPPRCPPAAGSRQPAAC